MEEGGIVALVLGIIASIITIFVFTTGRQSLFLENPEGRKVVEDSMPDHKQEIDDSQTYQPFLEIEESGLLWNFSRQVILNSSGGKEILHKTSSEEITFMSSSKSLERICFIGDSYGEQALYVIDRPRRNKSKFIPNIIEANNKYDFLEMSNCSWVNENTISIMFTFSYESIVPIIYPSGTPEPKFQASFAGIPIRSPGVYHVIFNADGTLARVNKT